MSVASFTRAYLTLAFLLTSTPQASAQIADNFAGHYEVNSGQFFDVTRIAAGRYKISFSVMIERGGGSFDTVEWETTGTARGTVLAIDSDNCRIAPVPAKASRYKLTGCADADGLYQRKAMPR